MITPANNQFFASLQYICLHYVFKDPSAAWNIIKAVEACLSFNLGLEKYHQLQFGKLELQTLDV